MICLFTVSAIVWLQVFSSWLRRAESTVVDYQIATVLKLDHIVGEFSVFSQHILIEHDRAIHPEDAYPIHDISRELRQVLSDLGRHIKRIDMLQMTYQDPQFSGSLDRLHTQYEALHTIVDQPELWRDQKFVLGQINLCAIRAEQLKGIHIGECTLLETKHERYTHNGWRAFYITHAIFAAIIGFIVFGLLRQIRDILNTRNQFQDNLIRERRLFIGGPSVVFRWVAAEGWPVEYVSPNVKEMFGYSAADLMSGEIPFADIVHPDDLTRVADEVAQHTKNNDTRFVQDYRIVRADGVIRYLYDFTVIHKDNGVVTHYEGYVLDITEQKHAEQLLQKSEAALREAQHIAHIGSWSHSLIDEDKIWSDEVFEILGIEHQEPNIDITINAVHPEDKNQFLSAIRNTIEKHEPLNIEIRIIKPNGDIRYVHDQGSVIFDEQGDPLRMTGTIQDVTDRKEMENILRESEERFRTITDSVPCAIYRCALDEHWTMDFIGGQIEEISGYPASDFINNHMRSYASIVHPEDAVGGPQKIEDAINADLSYSLEYRVCHRDGSKRFVHEEGYAIRDERGEVKYLDGFIMDESRRKTVERTLAEKTMMLDNILRSASGYAIATTDLDFRITYYNPVAEEYFGYTAKEVIGRTVQEMHVTEKVASERLEQAIIEVRETGEYRYAIEQQTEHGERILASVVSGIFDADDIIVGYALFSQDVTESIHAQNEILKRAETERKMLQELDHRVRNNLASLIALIDISAQGSTDTNEFAQSVQSRVRSMATVHSLLSKSHWQPIDLKIVIAKSTAIVQSVNINVAGPSVPVPPQQVQPLAMVLNELAINSHKYGALSASEGVIAIDFDIIESNNEQYKVAMSWIESGGPEPSGTITAGTGLGLVKGMVKSDLRGSIDITFPPCGASHAIELTFGNIS